MGEVLLTQIAAVGTLISVVGSIQQASAARAQGRAEQQAAEFQAAVARNNQILAERAAEDALARGQAEVAQEAERTKALVARQRVVQAGLGQTVDVGSALDLNIDAIAAGKLADLTIRNNAEREALGFRTQGLNFQSEAILLRLEGANVRAAAKARSTGFLFEAGGTLLTKTVPKVASFLPKRI